MKHRAVAIATSEVAPIVKVYALCACGFVAEQGAYEYSAESMSDRLISHIQFMNGTDEEG